MTDLLDQISRLQKENAAVEDQVETVEDQLKKQHAKSQSGIAWVIIGTFVFSIVAIFFFVIFSQNGMWKEPAEFLFTLISSVMLPVVTLVLGYYFGTEQNRD